MGVLVLILTVSVAGLCQAAGFPGVHTSEVFNQWAVLDAAGNVTLFWNFNETDITFEVHASTRGWVGFGLSVNGNMYPGDVVIGWLSDNGTAHFADRHTTGHRPPVKDQSQDWHLLFMEENESGTVMKFVRKIRTCDKAEDMDIPAGTARVIYAYNPNDPASDDTIFYHGTRRGTKSLSLLSHYRVPESVQFDFLNQNYVLPNASTTYRCLVFKLPEIGLRHMIKYEPVITPGNELNVHHVVITRCQVPDPAAIHGASGLCYEGRPKTVPACSSIVLAWAIGGQAFYFPDNAGFPIGDPSKSVVYVMETHYDNPTQRTGVLDNSGIRITLTKSLRQNDADMLEIGAGINVMQVVPPNKQAFLSTSYCTEHCIAKGLADSGVSEIKMFGALQHAHLLGVGIKTRHFRNGTEIKPLIEDPDYDFNFQETRIFPQEVSAYPGDSFMVECTYDSRGRTGPTFGGLSTKEEMCLTFVYYYPKMALKNCISVPTYNKYGKGNAELYRMFVGMDWYNSTVENDFEQKLATSHQYQSCLGEAGDLLNNGRGEVFLPFSTDHPYVPTSPGYQ